MARTRRRADAYSMPPASVAQLGIVSRSWPRVTSARATCGQIPVSITSAPSKRTARTARNRPSAADIGAKRDNRSGQLGDRVGLRHDHLILKPGPLVTCELAVGGIQSDSTGAEQYAVGTVQRAEVALYPDAAVIAGPPAMLKTTAALAQEPLSMLSLQCLAWRRSRRQSDAPAAPPRLRDHRAPESGVRADGRRVDSRQGTAPDHPDAG